MRTSSRTSEESVLRRLYQYAEDVIEGRQTACEKVRAACTRFKRELEYSKDPSYSWRFDERLAARPCLFIEMFLKPTKGDYDRMELLPWQCFVEGNLYGWVSKETGLRRFTEGLIVVGRGNGKSTLMAGNAAYGASKDGEPGADVYLLANSKEQAGIVFNECKRQIENSPALASRFRTLRDGIHYDRNDATIRHRSSDSHKLAGLNPHMAIFDEIYEYKSTDLIDQIKRGSNKRRQPLILYITTMGTVLDGVLSRYYQLFTDAMTEGMLDPAVSDRMFSFICELDRDDDPDDPDTWIKANPSMGHFLMRENLERDWQRAKLVPQEKADFITKQLNVSVDNTEATYLSQEVIDRNRAVFDPDALLGRACYAGYDLSSREDFTAACLLFPNPDGTVSVIHHSWTTKRKVELNNEKIDYYNWAMLGILTICEGEYVPQDAVFEWFREQGEKYEILTIGYDPANAIWLTRNLEAAGFMCKIVRQGPLTLNDPMKDFKEAMTDGRVVMNNDPMLRWYMHNVRLRDDYADREKENWMPTKRNRYRKIDGFMALIDAWCTMSREGPADEFQEPQITVYSL